MYEKASWAARCGHDQVSRNVIMPQAASYNSAGNFPSIMQKPAARTNLGLYYSLTRAKQLHGLFRQALKYLTEKLIDGTHYKWCLVREQVVAH